MFDPIGFLNARIFMRRAAEAAQQRLADAITEQQAVQRTYRILTEQELLRDQGNYIELGTRDRGTDGDY